MVKREILLGRVQIFLRLPERQNFHLNRIRSLRMYHQDAAKSLLPLDLRNQRLDRQREINKLSGEYAEVRHSRVHSGLLLPRGKKYRPAKSLTQRCAGVKNYSVIRAAWRGSFLARPLNHRPHLIGKLPVLIEFARPGQPLRAINRDAVAVDVLRLRTQQINRKVRQFIVPPKSLHRMILDGPLFKFLALHQPRPCPLSRKWPRRNSIESNVVPRPFHRKRARHGQHPCLGARRRNHIPGTSPGRSISGNNIQNIPRLLSLNPLTPQRQSAMKRAAKHNAHHRRKSISRKFLRARHKIPRSVVNQRIDPADFLYAGLHSLLDCREITNVAGSKPSLHAFRLNFLRGSLQRLRPPRHKKNVRPKLSKPQRH